MRNQSILIGIIILLPVIALSQTDIQVKGKQELLERHDRFIQFMQEADLERLKEFYPENHTSLELSKGMISTQNYTKLYSLMQGYFQSVVYHDFEDIEGPYINVSPDGNMAWILRSMRVSFEMKQGGMKSNFRGTGIDVMEKRDGKWIEVASSYEYKFDRKKVKVDLSVLEEYEGAYHFADQGKTFHAEIENGALQLRGPTKTVKSVADTEYSFHLEDDSADVIFIRDRKGVVSHMLLVTEGSTVALPRVEG